MQHDPPAAPTAAVRLDQFLKMTGATGTGGQAKVLIQSGWVKVNGQIETRRRRKLAIGDVVEVDGQHFVVKEQVGSE